MKKLLSNIDFETLKHNTVKLFNLIGIEVYAAKALNNGNYTVMHQKLESIRIDKEGLSYRLENRPSIKINHIFKTFEEMSEFLASEYKNNDGNAAYTK